MSADNDQQKVAQCLQNGAKDYILKPVRPKFVQTLYKYIPIYQNRPIKPGQKFNQENYKIIKKIGSGAMGKVQLIVCQDDNKQYAMKTIIVDLLNVKQKQQAKNQAALLRVLKSPAIIQYYHSEIKQDKILIFMEYAKGGSLDQLIKQQSQIGTYFKQEEIIKFTAQLCVAAQLMFFKHIIHRDLKPQNIFLDKYHDVKVGDFGISRALESKDQLIKTFVGTPYYMSPELIQGEPYGHKSDIWALGCIIYEMIMLKRPFDGNNIDEVNDYIKNNSPAQIRKQINPQLRNLVELMLSKNPQKRPTIIEITKIRFIKEEIENYLKLKSNQNAKVIDSIKENSNICKESALISFLDSKLNYCQVKQTIFYIQRKLIAKGDLQELLKKYQQKMTIQDLLKWQIISQSTIQGIQLPINVRNIIKKTQYIEMSWDVLNTILNQIKNNPQNSPIHTLAQVDISKFSQKGKCVFWLNVFNIMNIHSKKYKPVIKYKVNLLGLFMTYIPLLRNKIKTKFDVFKYKIANQQFTPSQVFHGILLKNYKKGTFQGFQKGSPKQKMMIKPDKRYLFLLYIGKSLPFFNQQQFEDQLNTFVKSIINVQVKYNELQDILRLPQFLKKYESLFSDSKQLIKWLKQFKRNLDDKLIIKELQSGNAVIQYNDKSFIQI